MDQRGFQNIISGLTLLGVTVAFLEKMVPWWVVIVMSGLVGYEVLMSLVRLRDDFESELARDESRSAESEETSSEANPAEKENSFDILPGLVLASGAEVRIKRSGGLLGESWVVTFRRRSGEVTWVAVGCGSSAREALERALVQLERFGEAKV